MNNTTKYEALVLGLCLALDHGVKNVRVFRDLELVVNQVRRRFHCKLLSLQKYKHRVWDLIESFEDFNLTPIPREQKRVANLLITSVVNLLSVSQTEWRKFTIEVVSCPTVIDNMENF